MAEGVSVGFDLLPQNNECDGVPQGMKALLLLLVATGCDVRYLARGIVDGQRTYDIECKNDFALCREKASDLCPGGYDTVRSRKVQGFDHDPARRPLLNRYELDIACRDFDRSK